VNVILVGEATYRATRDLIDYRDAGAVEAKGKAGAIRAWEAIAPRSELGVDVVQTGQTPLIGRDQELTLLLNTAQRVRDAREPQLVTLIGRLETKGPLRFNQPKLRLHLRLPRSLPTAATRAGEP